MLAAVENAQEALLLGQPSLAENGARRLRSRRSCLRNRAQRKLHRLSADDILKHLAIQ